MLSVGIGERDLSIEDEVVQPVERIEDQALGVVAVVCVRARLMVQVVVVVSRTEDTLVDPAVAGEVGIVRREGQAAGDQGMIQSVVAK